MARVVHFDISAEKPERALKFYADAFGWTAQKWEGGGMPYWLITTGPDGEPGINGGLSRRESAPGATMNTVQVTSLEQAVAAVTRAGGKVTSQKSAIPGVGWFAQIEDTEGNRWGLMQPDTAAR